MSEQTRGIVMASCGVLVLALNVIGAVDRGVRVEPGHDRHRRLLFYGVAVVSRTGRS